MADAQRIHSPELDAKCRTAEQELAAGFLQPFRIAERRRRIEADGRVLRLASEESGEAE